MAEASFLILFFIFFFFSTALYKTTAQRRFTNITRGSSLTPNGNSSWPSPSGLYAFGFYKQGTGYSVGIFISGIPEKTVVWTAKRDDTPVNQSATLLLTALGMLVLRPTQGQDINLGSDSQTASSASMLDTGNFVLYNSDQEIIWQSFDYPTDTILVGQPLLNEGRLISSVSMTDHSSGFSALIMQSDGNLVQYPLEAPFLSQYAYYASGTYGAGSINTTLNLDDDGRLYIFNSSSSITIKNISDGGLPKKRRIYLVRNDADGIFRLYSYNLVQQRNWSTLWASSDNRCDPKGFCGYNGYCVLDDTQPQCLCIPGFDFVDPGDWRAGCIRNSTIQSCKNNDGSIQYNMLELANTSWEDTSYSTLADTSEEECKSECVKDCNCEAALFKGRQCKMQRLPLRFGRRDLGDSNVALIKVEYGSIKEVQDPLDHLPKEKKKELQFQVVIIIISVAAFAFIVVMVSGTIVYRNRVWAYKMISEKGNEETCENFGLKAFSYAELETMTNGFRDEIGRGSFGTVYRGTIQNKKKVVAVKRLEKGLVDGEREFQTEMKVIGKTHHKNLVKLLGYCLEGDKRLLVYEYMVGGSLANVLFEHESQQLCWEVRVGIAKDIARGLLYLHDECEMQIIHCDIKPYNILMDEFMCAKVADFGIAKLLNPDQTKTFTGIRGTKGYVAPEWHRNMPVTVKADVYSFGVVLLEIITRRRSVDMNLPEEEAILEEWVCQCFEDGELGKLVGDDEVVDKRKLDQMVKVGLWCIQDEPSLRPSMKKVLLMLEGTVDIPIPPNPTSFLSAV